MEEKAHTYTRASVLLVHGIGDTAPGSVLEPAVKEIHRQLSDATQTRLEDISSDSDRTKLLYQSLRWKQIQLDLTEFHWSGLAGKIRRTHFLTSFRYLVSILWFLPGLGAWGSKSPARHVFAKTLGGFQVLCLFVIMLMSVWILAADFYEYLEIDGFDIDSLDSVFAVLLFGTLVPSAAIALLLFIKNGKMTGWAAQWLGVALGNLLLSYIWIFLVIAFAIVFVFIDEVIGVDHDLVSFGSLLLLPLGFLPFYVLVQALAFAADLFRDVIHYLAVDDQGREHQDTLDIKAELHSRIDKLIEQGSDRIVIVAHSLGTAITAEVLMERMERKGQRHVMFEYITCGSPLKRTLHRLLPQRIPHPEDLYAQLKSQDAFRFGRWINIYRVADYVGKSLSRRRWFTQSRVDDGTSGIQDILIKPWWRPPLSHSNYWGDERFMRILVKQFLTPQSDSDK